MKAVFFSHQNPANPISAMATDINRDIHQFWLQVVDNEEYDADSLIIELMRITGQSRADINHAFNAVFAMKSLPELRKLQETHFFLTPGYLSRIMKAVAQADSALWPELDRRIAHRLTPRMANEVLIQAGALAGLICKWIKELDPTFEVKNRKALKEYLFIEHKNGVTYLRGKFDVLDGHCLEKAFLKLRKKKESLVSAFVNLLRSKVRIVQNFFTPSTGGSAWVSGIGYVDRPQSVDSERNLDQFSAKIENAYTPSVGLRNYVVARDGYCRAPGCTVPAERCQLDHVIPYGDGGATEAANLVCLCQRHHNMKTDKRFSTSVNLAAELKWIGPMLVPAITRPLGPLATEMPTGTWGQTWKSRMESR